jgi:hypothetical protein
MVEGRSHQRGKHLVCAACICCVSLQRNAMLSIEHHLILTNDPLAQYIDFIQR